MFHRCQTFMSNVQGFSYESIEVSIQKKGIPSFEIKGVPIKVAIGIKGRIKAAFAAAHIKIPPAKILVLFTDYSNATQYHYYDLQIALSIMGLFGMIPANEKICALGELCMDSTIKACELGSVFHEFAQNMQSSVLISHSSTILTLHNSSLCCYKATSLVEVLDQLKGIAIDKLHTTTFVHKVIPPMTQIKGNYKAKRCLEISVSGGHHMLLIGPPGVGKTSLANFIPYLHTTHRRTNYDYYIRNILNNVVESESTVPLLSPALGTSFINLFGQESDYSKSLLLKAHMGFLFFDEFLEFPRKYLESLKKILDEQKIGNNACDFTLIAACNPCACGNFGSQFGKCTCTPASIHKYRSKMSGGLLDRFHLMTYIDANDAVYITSSVDEHPAWFEKSKARITAAFESTAEPVLHSTASKNLLERAIFTYKLSSRSVTNILKVSRTIAKLELSPDINESHILEALSFRPNLVVS